MSDQARLYGEIAIDLGYIQAEQLDQALAQQREENGARPLGEILIQLGHLTRPQANAIGKLKAVRSTSREPSEDDEDALDISGITLGGCLVLDRVGSGSMGTTFRAHHLRLDRDVLVKVLHPRLVDVEGNLERFGREARAAAALEHPNVVSIYDFDSDQGYHFIIMQFVDGQNLRQVITHRGAFGLRRALWIGARVLEGLIHAHSKAIVHRDIKPANIMITREPRIKITDFGLVRILSLATSEAISSFGEIIGTPQYMAPEQASGEEVDHRADLYSLGISVFELIAGRPPFTGNSTLEVLEKHIMEPLPKLVEFTPDSTAEVQTYLEKLTAKDPNERFQTAEEALRALQELRSGDRVTGRFGSVHDVDPSRDLEAPAIISEQALEELKLRLRHSQHLVMFEGEEASPTPTQAPDAREEVIESAFANTEVTSALLKARRAFQRAQAAGQAEHVLPQLFKALLDQGHVQEVLALEREVERQVPTSAAGAFFAGQAFEREEDMETARARYALSVALAPDHLPARLHLAKVLVALERVDEAVRTLEDANVWHPTSEKAAVRLAEVLYVVKGDPKAAVPAYERAIELAPTRWQLRQQLALILSELGETARAEAVLEEVIKWRPDAAPAKRLLERIRRSRNSKKADPDEARHEEPDTRARLDGIRLQAARGAWPKALELAEEGLRERPRSIPLLLARARILAELKRLDEAEAVVKNVLTHRSDSTAARSLLKEIQRLRNPASSGARPPVEVVAPTGGSGAADDLLAAKTAAEEGHWERALELVDRLLPSMNKSLDVLLMRARALHELNRPGDAVQAYGLVLSLDPDHDAAHEGLAAARQARKAATERLAREP